ncbi:AAA family ATPase [Pseudomonas alkylphenolica]|uniref:AAA family ATPase n=1 Tax=Pseudomonas alkylphenolica TaxID=237609 RepID=UPI00315D8388
MNAPIPNLIGTTVRITRIRSQNRHGCIAFGHRVDQATGLNDRANGVVVSVPTSIADISVVTVGSIFEIYGEASTIQRVHGSFSVSETQILVQDIKLVRPSGSQVIQWLADNIKGIGEVKATSLWDACGERLYEVLDQAEHSTIQMLIPSLAVREGLFKKWAESGDAKTLRFVQDRDIPLDLARKVIKFHGKQTVEALIADPYRLLSFEGSWQRVDQIARDKFGMTLADPLRLAAALEEALYRVSAKGHTCATLSDLRDTFTTLIKPLGKPTEALAKALLQGKETGQFICREKANGDLMLYAPGTYIMERQCAEFVRSLLRNPDTQHQLFHTDVEALLNAFEQEEKLHLGIPSFTLNNAQRTAVKTSFSNRFSIITGGAGVGKTTVLKALYKALDTLGRPRFQMALSGRAAARMTEATQEEAMTIAGFLRNVTEAEMGSTPVVIIDEASMLDLVTFYKLTQKLPEGTHLILVGDPYQLPPIGAGLVLHVLCELVTIPCTQLTEVKRQAKDSAIPAASKAIREGEWPEFSADASGEVVFLGCADDQIIDTVLKLYEQDQEGTQILSATRSCLFAGVKTINRICHGRYASEGRHLMAENPETGELEATGFCVGDLLLYTANDWRRNLQNGCLGELLEVFDHSIKVNLGDDENPDMRLALGRAIYEGVGHYVLDSDVDLMEHAYAITVHKSQGSQFRRVIVPVRESRLLDRTFIYTAVTRAQVQIILVGDVDAVRRAITLPPKAFSRKVGLVEMMAA